VQYLKEKPGPKPFSIESAEKRIRAGLKRGRAEFVKVGRDLLNVKENLGHGSFMAWLEPRLVEWEISGQTARNYMNMAKRADKLGADVITKMPFRAAAKSTKSHKPRKVTTPANAASKIPKVVNLPGLSWTTSESAQTAVMLLVDALEATGNLQSFDREYCLAGKDAFEQAYLTFMNLMHPMEAA
jgi:hypothetical protein